MEGVESVASSLAAPPTSSSPNALPGAPGASGPVTTALEEGEAPRILVPLDGSPLAESIVSQLDIAVPGTAALELIRVVIPPMITPALTGASPHSVAGVLEEQLGLAGQYVEAIAARLQQNGCAVRTAVVADLSPASAIAAHAHEHRCDAIAIATRGRGGIDRLLLGSVADKVIRAAEVPVLVWNPPSGAATRVIDAKEAMMNDDDVRAVAAYVWSITHPPRIPPAVQRA